ncbi:o-succinylbenzoate--CoA ligase [Sporosarcina thermotolerans]|uniref:2-succinylbenzoate--CoA ligase n=1 Tax=Sporosarcina thermotolerans TaxID=633404 RepID=A0AAW9A5B9_9BACL|nr:o-succinylbenzoate--CoA ligase [Sporosarcina thermotolerans]MDW0116045.1 o-succinylbenzoate--CoA ligase [Sporosarcina thermotolerans]
MIPNWLLKRSSLTPSRTALSFCGKQWTFQELKQEADLIARKLRMNGLEEGDRIALLGPSNPDMVFVIHGCLLAGLEIVMLNSRLSTKEILWQLGDANASLLIVEDELLRQTKIQDVPMITFSSLQSSEQRDFTISKMWNGSRTITIMYTSGTTGFPKGVRQTAGNHTSSALSSVLNLGLTEEDSWLCTMPLFHISGFSILVRSVIYGMEVKLYEKFDTKTIVDEIRNGTATRMSVVATSLRRILEEFEETETVAHPTFRTMLAGGGPVPDDFLRRAESRKLPVLQTYGMTETSSQTATLSSEDALRKSGSAGKPLFFNQIKIRDTEQPGELGEVLIAGPHVTPGYIGHAVDRDPLEDGWLPTGDIGYFDDEGYLFIVDRRSDLIISGGENIYPAEVENALLSHPLVKEAGVCGQSHPVWGSVPVAFIVLSGDVAEEELDMHCGELLARYKIPKAYYFVDQLPRNASNKLLRRELKEWASLK